MFVVLVRGQSHYSYITKTWEALVESEINLSVQNYLEIRKLLVGGILKMM